jgi:Tol biopolymer transport system component
MAPIEPPGDTTFTLPNGWRFTKPVNLGPVVNSGANDWAPALSADGLTLMFASNRKGGPGSATDLWTCTRESLKAPFKEPARLDAPVNSNSDDTSPAFSADGLTLLIASDRPGGHGDHDLWTCTRLSVDESFGEPINLGSTVNSTKLDSSPTLSGDGLTLIFQSARSEGQQDSDLWMCSRASLGTSFGQPVSLGPTVNSSVHECEPTLSSDGLTLVFARTPRPDMQGGRDLWMCIRESQSRKFGTAVNLGPGINTSFGESGPFISEGGRTLLFCSDRPGGHGGEDIWICTRVDDE